MQRYSFQINRQWSQSALKQLLRQMCFSSSLSSGQGSAVGQLSSRSARHTPVSLERGEAPGVTSADGAELSQWVFGVHVEGSPCGLTYEQWAAQAGGEYQWIDEVGVLPSDSDDDFTRAQHYLLVFVVSVPHDRGPRVVIANLDSEKGVCHVIVP